MKLSEAIMLGRHLIPAMKEVDTATCAIGAAMKANGLIVLGGKETHRDMDVFVSIYPWLCNLTSQCPRCPQLLYAEQIIWHPFDAHVMVFQDMTYEQLGDFIASIEPKELPETAAQEQTEVIQALA